MRKDVEETVHRMSSRCVGDDCVQLMIPYKQSITILDRNGIVYHHKKGCSDIINKYITDERRKQFPYHSIPTHYERFIGGKYQYANQLFDFEQPYIILVDNGLVESYVVKDNDEALLLNKFLPMVKHTTFKTREEIEKMIDQPFNENEQLYYLYPDGTMPKKNNFSIPSEKKILEHIRNSLLENVDEIKKYMKEEPDNTFTYYFKENDFLKSFIDKSIEKIDLNDYELNLQLLKGKTLLLAKTNGTDINIEGLDIYFISPNHYKVDSYDMPITKYTLEQIKYLTPKITKLKEPKISPRLNPGITKDDIRREKQLILKKK